MDCVDVSPFPWVHLQVLVVAAGKRWTDSHVGLAASWALETCVFFWNWNLIKTSIQRGNLPFRDLEKRNPFFKTQIYESSLDTHVSQKELQKRRSTHPSQKRRRRSFEDYGGLIFGIDPKKTHLTFFHPFTQWKTLQDTCCCWVGQSKKTRVVVHLLLHHWFVGVGCPKKTSSTRKSKKLRKTHSPLKNLDQGLP